MHIILGGTGHIGSALAQRLRDQGEGVTVVTHDATHTGDLERQGFQVAVVDLHDPDALREVFRRGQRAFLLNPPAAPSADTDTEERATVRAMLDALDGSGLHKVVAESTYGAQPAERAGDLGILYELEEGLARQPIPVSIIRGAYYMSNWDASLTTARDEGVVHTPYPTDFKLPMVAPADIAQEAARLMLEPVAHTGLHHVEGPERYSAEDVAVAFSAALKRPVRAVETPRDQWVDMFKQLGFSDPAAESYARMTGLTLDGPTMPEDPARGPTSLDAYVAQLVQRSH